MIYSEDRIWEPTVELRWVLNSRADVPEMTAPRLQQKWIERYPTCVVATYRGEERRVPGSETGNFEWRDVPAVMEGIERAGYKVTEALDNLKPR
jgi:hypothetical protein